MKPGFDFGETDGFGYFVTTNEVTSVTSRRRSSFGLDAHQLSYPYLGLNQRLIGAEGKGRVRYELVT